MAKSRDTRSTRSQGTQGDQRGGYRDHAADPLVTELSKDLRRLQTQKFRHYGGVEARMLMALAAYYGEHLVQQARDSVISRPIIRDEDKNKLFLVFNLIKRYAKRKMGRLWSARYEYKATPNVTDPQARDKSDVITKLLSATDRKLRERRQHWQRIWWTVLTGVAIEHTPWIEEATEEPLPQYDENGELLWREAQTGRIIPQSAVIQLIQQGLAAPERFTVVQEMTTCGEVGSQVISGFNFFIDAAVPSIDLLSPDQRCYILETKTVEWVREVFGSEKADQIQSSVGQDLGIIRTKLGERGPIMNGVNLQDLIPAIQGSRGPDDPPLCLVATAYQPAGKECPHGQRTIFVPNQCILDDAENQYDEIPLTDFHFDAETTGFWSPDFVTDIFPANKFLSKRMSQLGEMANAQIYETLLLGGGLTKADIPSDMPGTVEGGLSDDGEPLVKALQHSSPAPFFLESIKLNIELMDRLGVTDITGQSAKFQQMRGPLALPILQELIDSEDGPLFEHIGEQLARVKGQRVSRVKQFYPGIRTLRYTGRSKQDEVLIFHTDDVLRSGIDFEITIDQRSIMPEIAALREARIVERLSGPLAGLYADKRTGKLDFSKVAMDLRYGDEDREDRESQYRSLAGHLIQRLWELQPLPPDIPYAFWDHAVILDELESVMATTEFLEASQECKAGFIGLYERCRDFLAAIQQSQMDAVQGQMMQGAVAQATQQAAAKAASLATDAALTQVDMQERMAQANMGQEAAPASMAVARARRDADRSQRTDRPDASAAPQGPAPRPGRR